MSMQGGPVLFGGNPNGVFMPPATPAQTPPAATPPNPTAAVVAQIDPVLLKKLVLQKLNFGAPAGIATPNPQLQAPQSVGAAVNAATTSQPVLIPPPLPPATDPSQQTRVMIPPEGVLNNGSNSVPPPPMIPPEAADVGVAPPPPSTAWSPAPSVAQPNIGDYYHNLPPYPVPDLQRRGGLQALAGIVGLLAGRALTRGVPGGAANVASAAIGGVGQGADVAQARAMDQYNRQLQLDQGRFEMSRQSVGDQNKEIDAQNTVGAFNARTHSTADNVDKRVGATVQGQQAGLLKAGAAAVPKLMDFAATLDHDGQVAMISAHNQTYGTHIPVPGTPSGQFQAGTDQDGNPVRTPVMVPDYAPTPTDKLRQAQIAKDEGDTALAAARTTNIPLDEARKKEGTDQTGVYQAGLVANGATQAGASVTRAGAAVTAANAAATNAATGQFRAATYLKSVDNQNFWNVAKINDDRVKIAQANGQTKDPAQMSAGQLLAEQTRINAQRAGTTVMMQDGKPVLDENGNVQKIPLGTLAETQAGQAYNALLQHYIDVKQQAAAAVPSVTPSVAGGGRVLPLITMPPINGQGNPTNAAPPGMQQTAAPTVKVNPLAASGHLGNGHVLFPRGTDGKFQKPPLSGGSPAVLTKGDAGSIAAWNSAKSGTAFTDGATGRTVYKP